MGNEYIATEAEAFKEESVASVAEKVECAETWPFCSKGYNLQEMTKSLNIWKYLLEFLQFHEQ